VHRPPYCCVLPVVTLRVLTAVDLLPAHIQRGPASRNSSSSCTSFCSQQSNRRTSECAIRLCRCYGYRAGQQRAVARRCASSLRRHDLGQVLGNLFALVFFRVRRPFVFRTEISLSCAVRMRPSSLSAAKRTTDKCPCPLPSRLNSDNRAKPPANPMDIACPVSSMWVTLHLIRFRKRPLHFSAVTEGFALGKAVPSMVLFRRVDARARGW
jgi:hypothetical protein